jgi:anti-sigma B factor antagonist
MTAHDQRADGPGPPAFQRAITGNDYLEIAVREGTDACVVVLRGELDLGSVDLVVTHLRGPALDGRSRVIVDLRELAFIDATGLHALLDAGEAARSAGKRLALVAGSSRLHRVFVLAGLVERSDWATPWDGASV